jgi:hypothetical protein
MTTENARTQTQPAFTYSKSNSSRGIRASKLRRITLYTINLFKILFQPKKVYE